jgi:hypothetical protein
VWLLCGRTLSRRDARHEFGGVVSIADKAGKAQALMIGTDAGGEMHVVNVMHKGSVAVKAPATG